jgi:hypothetical protein
MLFDAASARIILCSNELATLAQAIVSEHSQFKETGRAYLSATWVQAGDQAMPDPPQIRLSYFCCDDYFPSCDDAFYGDVYGDFYRGGQTC